MKMVKDLVLSRRTRLEFVELPEEARLKLAAVELERLVKTRFAGKAAPDQTVEVFFEVKENAKGFSVKVLEKALLFTAPDRKSVV